MLPPASCSPTTTTGRTLRLFQGTCCETRSVLISFTIAPHRAWKNFCLTKLDIHAADLPNVLAILRLRQASHEQIGYGDMPPRSQFELDTKASRSFFFIERVALLITAIEFGFNSSRLPRPDLR